MRGFCPELADSESKHGPEMRVDVSDAKFFASIAALKEPFSLEER
jgi:hypothetical protein